MGVTSRNILLDLFKVIACITIVCFHCGFLFEYNEFLNYVTFKGIFRFALPLFITINGFFLHDIFKNNKLNKWLKRISILYVIWMFIYAYFWFVPNYKNPIKILLYIFFGFNHLWYLVSFLVAGLLLYCLRNFSNKSLTIIAVLLYLIGYCIQMLGDLSLISEPTLLVKLVNYPPSHRNFLFFDLPFLSIGYVIKRSNFHLKTTKKQVIELLILSFFLLTLESVINYYYNVDLALSIISLSSFLAGPMILISAFSFSVSSRLDSKLLSLYSIAIYLIHPLIIIIITSFHKVKPTPLTLITLVLSFTASYFLIQLNKKLKFLL